MNQIQDFDEALLKSKYYVLSKILDFEDASAKSQILHEIQDLHPRFTVLILHAPEKLGALNKWTKTDLGKTLRARQTQNESWLREVTWTKENKSKVYEAVLPEKDVLQFLPESWTRSS